MTDRATQTALNLANRSESLPVRECKFCGAEIAWVKSRKTGKNYPANVVHTHSESATRLYNLRVAPWDPHTRAQCEERQAQRAETRREISRDEAARAYIAEHPDPDPDDFATTEEWRDAMGNWAKGVTAAADAAEANAV